MLVRNLLDRKGINGAKMASIDADTDIATAARELAAQRIGAVVVLGPDGGLEGILTERDVLHAVALFGDKAAGQTVAACMTRNLITCAPTDRLEELFRAMIDNGIRHLAVRESDRLVGLLSLRDLTRALVSATETENRNLRNLVRDFRTGTN